MLAGRCFQRQHSGWLPAQQRHGRLHGLRSLRVGTYRIISHLAGDDQTVCVAAIRHRSIAYRTDPR